jgi:hypothetical protein
LHHWWDWILTCPNWPPTILLSDPRDDHISICHTVQQFQPHEKLQQKGFFTELFPK